MLPPPRLQPFVQRGRDLAHLGDGPVSLVSSARATLFLASSLVGPPMPRGPLPADISQHVGMMTSVSALPPNETPEPLLRSVAEKSNVVLTLGGLVLNFR